MKENNVIQAKELINKLFKNINMGDFEKSIQVNNTWKEILETIKSNSLNGNNIGKNMAAHSKVSDLKNGILLIEVDHSGWIQMIKTYQKYIMNGLKNKIPELKINALAFKLSGTDIKLAQISEEIFLKKEKDRLEKKYEEEEKILNKFSNLNEKQYEKKKLPPELEKIFNDLKSDMLTKDK